MADERERPDEKTEDEKPVLLLGAPEHRPMTDEDIEKFADAFVDALPAEAFRTKRK